MSFNGLLNTDYLKISRLDETSKKDLLDFTATDFSTLRNNLINYIKASYPLDYNYFVESDLGVMLIELVAAMGHIISYKTDFLANENYLATAQKRNSVKKLLDLIGVRMKGPTSAAANATLVLQQTRTTNITIPAANRTFTITSPEDSTQLSYTIYKYNPNGFVELDDPTGDLQIPFTTDSSSVISNLIILEGNLVKQTGIFSDTDSIKNIFLNQSPIIEGSVQVEIIAGNETTTGNYRQVDNIFFASGPNDKVFQLVTNDSFAGVVVFGDNLTGKSPAVQDSYAVYYRIGGGTRGNLAKGVVNVPISYLDFTGSIAGTVKSGTLENTSMATGGTNAQTIENAKRYAPLLFKAQNRLVTLNDYKAYVNNFRSSYGSVGKCTVVTRRAYSSANIIDLYILEKANDFQFKKATPQFKKQLLETIEDKKMLTDEVIVVDGLIRTIDPIMTIRCDKKYKQREAEIKLKVRDKVLQFFNVDNSEFGETFTSQELNTKIFEVPEVRYSTLDNLPQTIQTQFNEIIQLNNLTIIMVFE